MVDTHGEFYEVQPTDDGRLADNIDKPVTRMNATRFKETRHDAA